MSTSSPELETEAVETPSTRPCVAEGSPSVEDSRFPSGTNRMIVAGSLGLVAAGFLVAVPELGIAGVIGGALSGAGSAVAALASRK